MGAFGTKPFHNDDVLNDIGGYSNESELYETMNKILETGSRYYYPGYEFSALLLDTLTVPKYILNEQEAKQVLDEVIKCNKSKEIQNIITESVETWLSACTLNMSSRVLLLKKAIKVLESNINSETDDMELVNNMRAVFADAKRLLASNVNGSTLIQTKTLDKFIKANETKSNTTNLLQIRVIGKHYSGRKIVGYRIEDGYGRKNDVSPAYLKNAIREGTVHCINATLTSDDRLMVRESK